MPVQPKVKAIDALEARTTRYDEGVVGRPGLVVRVWPSGKKVFVHRFKVRREPFRLTIGTYGAISLEHALAEYQNQRLMLDRGENPAAQALRADQVEVQNPTVRQLAGRYLDEHARPRKRTARGDELTLQSDVLPKWGKLLAREITFADVDSLVAKIRKDKERGKTAPRRVLAVVRKMFSFAVKKRLVDANPAAGIELDPPPRARTRSLSEAELRVFLTSLPRIDLGDAFRDALRLQLLTGSRIGEVLGMHESEIDVDGALWTIPGDRTKNKLQQLVPLSDSALAVVKHRLAVSRMRTETRKQVWKGYLFPGHGTDAALRVDSIAHALKSQLPNFKDEHGKAIAPFASHALRRTVETGLAKLGVGKEIRDRVLNHKDASVGAQHYNTHDYLVEKRAALVAWEAKLSQIVSWKKSNVTPLKRSRRV